MSNRLRRSGGCRAALRLQPCGRRACAHARNYAAAGVRCFLVKAGEPSDKLDDPMIAADDLDALDIIAEHIARGGQDDVNDPLTTYRAVLESNGVETRPVIVISDAPSRRA